MRRNEDSASCLAHVEREVRKNILTDADDIVDVRRELSMYCSCKTPWSQTDCGA